MADTTEWKESTGSFWKPENKGDEVIGILRAIEHEVGDNKSTLYTVEQADGSVNVWGSAILDSRMKGIMIGEKVKIVYQGLGEKKAGKNPPKLWNVYHAPVKDDEIPF
jgi:hypothetical protein